jgi:hypothetical protein
MERQFGKRHTRVAAKRGAANKGAAKRGKPNKRDRSRD